MDLTKNSVDVTPDSPCFGCKNSCCGNNFLGMAGALRSASGNKRDFLKIRISETEANRIISAGYKEYLEYDKEGVNMKLNDDETCSAFKNGKCSIHDIRPNVCEVYPYYFDCLAGICIDKNCLGDFKLDEISKMKAYVMLTKRMLDFSEFDKITSK